MAPSRRELLQGVARLSGGLVLAPVLAALGAESAVAAESLSSELNVCRPLGDSLTALQQGNARFAAAWTAAAQGLTPAERMDLLQTQLDEHCLVDPDALKRGQAPWAAVLTCADSRIPLEWMFQAGAGELFAVRSAGNAVFNDGVASLEYAVAVLNVPLIMVLGHSDCGAVKAARGGDADLTPLLVELVTPIRASLQSGDDLSQAIRGNARYSAAQLPKRSALLAEAQASGKLQIVPAYFDIASGAVEFL